MAVARVFEAKGWSVDDYGTLMEKLVAQLGLADGESAPGVMFHWAAATDDGMRAVDVYESVDVADALVGNVIGPIAGALGLPLPTITQFDVHNSLRR